MDSRGSKLVSSPLWDSRICDEKAGLRRLLRGDKTDCLSHKQKASSLLYRAKPNPCQKWILGFGLDT
ncbi:hypothetical protein [Helicobacter zhangjianzhongii]|uniref:Uncharacterized protein n=1 Tax=Helicobacter zhangjianzhongii TaxID=2974574 RepID=A0ACC6FSW0_9HELI|nr:MULTISPECIES: hypothetical protein [unclassified Helicobacter]MDL0080227.1 hypothetical protein [Helicobacter sp. CPD2-1]MDL0082288.1 hypothetical protein [Helicobacter sp. XJK30-2]